MLALGAVDEEERDRRLVGHAEDRLEQLERRFVGPVEILEDQAERLLVGELADELEEDLERAGLDALAVQLPDRLRRLGLERQADEVGDERIGVVRLLPAEEVRQLGLQLEPDAGLGRRGADAEPLAQELADGPVREGLRVGDAARLDEAHAVAIAVAHLPDEPGLADPGLAHDGDDRAAALDERVHRPLEHGELEVAAQRSAGSAAAASASRTRETRKTSMRLAHALEVLRAELLEVEARLDLTLRRRADEDAALAGELLEARGDVDGVAKGVQGVVAVVAVLLDADDDRARVHTDADRERNAVGRLDLLRVLGERALDRERGAEGPLGVVLVRDGDAEERQHLVADELRHGAVEAPDLLGHDPHDLVDQELRALRAELFRDRRRADDVRDQHRDDPPFACCHRHRRSYSCVTVGTNPRRRRRSEDPGGRPRRREARPRDGREPLRRRERPRRAGPRPLRASEAARAPA